MKHDNTRHPALNAKKNGQLNGKFLLFIVVYSTVTDESIGVGSILHRA